MNSIGYFEAFCALFFRQNNLYADRLSIILKRKRRRFTEKLFETAEYRWTGIQLFVIFFSSEANRNVEQCQTKTFFTKPTSRNLTLKAVRYRAVNPVCSVSGQNWNSSLEVH